MNDDNINKNILKYAGILWNRTSGRIKDKHSTTTVVFFRSDGKLKSKYLYGVYKPKKC